MSNDDRSFGRRDCCAIEGTSIERQSKEHAFPLVRGELLRGGLDVQTLDI